MTSALPGINVNQPLYELSSPQIEIWLDQLISGDNPGYNIGGYLKIYGAIDPERFERAVNHWASRHDALRTILVRGSDGDSKPMQAFVDEMPVSAPFYDFSDRDAPHEVAIAWIRRHFSEPFKLYGGRLFECSLLKISDELFYSVNKLHHLISDGWSIDLLGRSLAEIYTALNADEADWPAAPSYTAFVMDDCRYRESSRFERDREYWLQKYRDIPEPLFSQVRQGSLEARTYYSNEQSWSMPRDMFERIGEFSKRNGTNVFHVVLGTLYV